MLFYFSQGLKLPGLDARGVHDFEQLKLNVDTVWRFVQTIGLFNEKQQSNLRDASSIAISFLKVFREIKLILA